uniref:Uncharacterized protein n=1 Tax=Oryza punctata TaxID=4537 RepID=A0A0E0JQP8_ORYPU
MDRKDEAHYLLNPLPIFPVGSTVKSPTSQSQSASGAHLSPSPRLSGDGGNRAPASRWRRASSPAPTFAGAPSVLRGCCQIQAVRLYPALLGLCDPATASSVSHPSDGSAYLQNPLSVASTVPRRESASPRLL